MLSEVSNYWTNASNCAQASAAGLLDHFGAVSVAQTFHSAFLPYGGGFKEGDVCGVVSGSLASLSYLLSLKKATKDQILELSAQFRAEFHNQFGTITCYGLTQEFRDDLHNTLPELKQQQRKRCDNAMEFATDLVCRLIEDFQSI